MKAAAALEKIKAKRRKKIERNRKEALSWKSIERKFFCLIIWFVWSKTWSAMSGFKKLQNCESRYFRWDNSRNLERRSERCGITIMAFESLVSFVGPKAFNKRWMIATRKSIQRDFLMFHWLFFQQCMKVLWKSSPPPQLFYLLKMLSEIMADTWKPPNFDLWS